MKHFLIAACILSLTAIGCNDASKTETTATTTDTLASSSDKMDDASTMNTTAPAPELDSATMMKNWQEYSMPTAPHQMMASWNGTWNGDVTMWHAPGAPPQTSKATAVNKMAMGGRYQVANHTGNMMGMPFEGMSTLAYDNAKKKFISTWIDNMGTGMMVLEGPWDEATKTMTLTGKCVDPSAGNGREMNVRETFKIVDANNQVMEMYGPGPDGKEFKMMEIKFTRKS